MNVPDLRALHFGRQRVSPSVMALVVAAVTLSLAGGVVPGIEHQVTNSNLSPEYSPENYLGPPSAGSISGLWAAEGALFWSAITVTGWSALTYLPRIGVTLLAIATLVTTLVNVVLPWLSPNANWSLLGVAQTVAFLGSLIFIRVLRD